MQCLSKCSYLQESLVKYERFIRIEKSDVSKHSTMLSKQIFETNNHSRTFNLNYTLTLKKFVTPKKKKKKMLL